MLSHMPSSHWEAEWGGYSRFVSLETKQITITVNTYQSVKGHGVKCDLLYSAQYTLQIALTRGVIILGVAYL